MDVLFRVLPFFILISVGLILGRLKKIDDTAARGLSAYVFWVGFPALLIHSLGHAPAPSIAQGGAFGVYALAAALPLLIAPLLGRALNWTAHERGGVAMAGSVGNTAFLGAPLAISVFGATAAPLVAQIVAIDCVLVLGLAVAGLQMAAHRTSALKAIGRAVTNPIVAAAVIGVSLSILKISLPAPLDTALSVASATGSPVALIALGVIIALEGGRPAPGEAGPIAGALVLKLILVPAAVWVGLSLVGADPLLVAVATLMAACPTAVNVFIQTRNHGVFALGGAQAVTLSTALSVLSLTALAAILTARLG